MKVNTAREKLANKNSVAVRQNLVEVPFSFIENAQACDRAGIDHRNHHALSLMGGVNFNRAPIKRAALRCFEAMLVDAQ